MAGDELLDDFVLDDLVALSDEEKPELESEIERPEPESKPAASASTAAATKRRRRQKEKERRAKVSKYGVVVAPAHDTKAGEC